MRLILARALAGRTLLAAAALAATVTTVLLTGFVLYADALPTAAVRAAVQVADPTERTLHVRSSAGGDAAELAARDAAVRDLFAGGAAGVALPVSSGGYATGQELPAEGGTAVVGFLPELPAHADLLAGAWPEPVPVTEPVQVAVPEPVATALGLAVGDRLELVDRRPPGEEPAPVEVVGVWRAVDPDDAYWRLLGVLELTGPGPFVVHPDEFTARYQRLGHLEWLAVPDPAALAEAGLPEFAADVGGILRELAQRRDADPALDASVRFTRVELTDLADQLAMATVVNRSGMVLPAALLAVTAGYGLVLVARLVSAHRRGEDTLLRARGASRRQLIRFRVTEAVLVVAPAALLGAPLGTGLLRLADDHLTDRSFSIERELIASGLAGPPLAWLVALAAALGCTLALAVPAAARGRTWVAEQQQRWRPARVATVTRAGADIALAALAVLAWLQLRQYQTAVSAGGADRGGLMIDPLLVAAPVLGVLAATALSLRALPLATRWGVRLAERRDTLAGLLGMWQADRRPHAGPVLLLVLAVATAVLAPAVASTWQQSQRDQATQQVGADLRIDVTNSSAANGDALTAAVAGSRAAMAVHRASLVLPDTGLIPLLAVDSDQAAQVVRLRPDLAAGSPAEVFARLGEGRPELSGLSLPAGTRELSGRVRFLAPDPVSHTFERAVFHNRDGPPTFSTEVAQVPAPTPERFTLHLRDRDGVIRAVPLGGRSADQTGDQTGGLALDAQGGWEFAVDLPQGVEKVVALGASVTARGWSSELLPVEPMAPVEVQVRWEELRAVDATGAGTRLEIPAEWEVRYRGPQNGPQPERVAGQPEARLTFAPERDYPSTIRFLLLPPPPALGVIPLAVTADVLATIGAEVGQTVRITGGAGGLRSARIAGVVEAMPGTPDGTGALVDLAWFGSHQLLWERPTPAVTEFWVALDPGAAPVTAQVEALSWAGVVRDREALQQRLLAEPLGSGMLVSLWTAAGAAAVLAGFGLVVDARATAVRRRRELAILHTLGAGPPTLARALVAEQAVLAGLGVSAGAIVGVAVAAAMGPSLILTPSGQVPVPAPVLALGPAQLAVPTLGLLVAAVALGAVVAWRARREVAAGVLQIGAD